MRLIDADKLIKTIPNTDIDMFDNCGRCTLLDKEEVIAIINKAPIIEAEPVRHGRWIHSGFMEVKCSNCGNVFHELEETNYCPSCGAKMKGEEE